MGDPAGIGPEVLLKYAAYEASQKTAPSFGVVAIGDGMTLQKTADALSLPLEFHFMRDFRREDLSPLGLNVLDLQNVPKEGVPVGTVGKISGKASVEYILKAIALAQEKEVDAIATGPICKESIHLAGYQFPGHTELLAKYTDTKDFAMMMVGGNIRVVLVTIHIPLSKVARNIKRDEIERIIRLADRSLALYEGKRPVLAVTALNPHAGEGGAFGREEIEEILPAIEACKRDGVQASGPYPADSLFARAKNGEFNAVVVMYHDQGLIPVKMEGFGKGINVTLGLPIIRTSVDHGVAFDIAGKGIADASSMRAAVHYAANMARMS